MTDRELLELAAKAAGLSHPDGWDWIRNPLGYSWDPLTDDGDALRLAVKLDIDFYMGAGDGPEAWAGYYLPGRENKKHACQPVNGDPYAATRRAIVMAAAEIGRNMK